MPWLDKELDDTMPAKRHVGPMSKSWHDRLGLRPNNSMEPTRPAEFGFGAIPALGWPGGSSRGR